MNSQYNFSYSGSDVKALIKSTDSNTAYKVLNTLTTVSFSVNEQKTPVRRLGRRHVVGFTKAIRTIAGTMVLTVLKGHPLTELYTVGDYYKAGEMGQGIHRPNSYHFATNVPPFDLKLIYQTEHNSNYYAELVIKGIEIISQSIVTSVNDMITECVLQFVARDYNEFINHVSGVTEQSHIEIITKTQTEQIKLQEETNIKNAESARELVTPEDIRTMVEFLEDLRTSVPKNVESAISKIKNVYSALKNSTQKNDYDFTLEEVENFIPDNYEFGLQENKNFIPDNYEFTLDEVKNYLPNNYDFTLNEVQNFIPDNYEFTLDEIQSYLPNDYNFTLDEVKNFIPNDYNFTLDEVQSYLPNNYEFTLEEVRTFLPNDYPLSLDGLPNNYVFTLDEVKNYLPNDYNFTLNEIQNFIPNDYNFTLGEVQNYLPNDYQFSLDEVKNFIPDNYNFSLEEIQNYLPNDYVFTLDEVKNYLPNSYNFSLEEVEKYLSSKINTSNKNQKDETNKLVNGLTKTEQNLIEEQGTLESEEERTAHYNKNGTF